MRLSKKGAVIVVLALMLGVPATMLTHVSSPATADPTPGNLLNGNKTATWDFSTPSDYAATNVALAGDAVLDQRNGQVTHTTTQDFENNNLTWDSANLTISGGSISTREQSKEIVADGGFDLAGAWEYTNSSDGNVTAGREAGNATGSFENNMPAPPSNHFDTMDTGIGWGVANGDIPPLHMVTDISQDMTHVKYGIASTRLTINFRDLIGNWAGVQNNSGPWDWSQYNTFSVWLDTNYTGPQNLETYLNLTSGAPKWNSSRHLVTPGWQVYEFDISGFSGLASVNMIQIRFTNVTNTSSVLVWIDDVWLYHFENGTATAAIYQDVVKAFYTPPTSSVSFSFSFKVDSSANLDANLTASVDLLWSSPPIRVNASSSWASSPIYNLSVPLSPGGTYNLNFTLDLSYDTPFATFLKVQIDNVSITVPDHRGGIYVSKAIDTGKQVFFDQVSWSNSSHPDTSVLVEVRGGWSPDTADGSWNASWEPHLASPANLFGGNERGRYLQYRVTLSTANSSASVSFDDISFTFHMFFDGGRVDTNDFTPPEFRLLWRLFNATDSRPPATSVSYSVSLNLGGTWTPVTPPSDLTAFADPQIRLRADLSTANTTLTPTVVNMTVTYEYRDVLDKISVSPATWSGTADETYQFTARAWDKYGHIVPFTPTWTEDDPAGSVDPSGLYSAGTAGTHVVCATAGGKTDCANVTVSIGVMASISISPPTATVFVGAERRFDATAEDSDGNDIALTATAWTTDVGMFSEIDVTHATLKAQGTPATGMVQVKQGVLTATATVQVTPSTTLYIDGRVPDQRHPEDSAPWNITLDPYLPPAENPDNLTWYLTGTNQSLYTVFGGGRPGQHMLWFTQRKDAFGNNPVTLWLEARNGSRVSQPLWINVTPVNDGPDFYDAPDITVKYGSPYVFDYTPYIIDVDTPLSSLVLVTGDPGHAAVQGLKVTYTYDASFNGQVVLVRLNVTDGQYYSETAIQVTVKDNTTPNVVKPLPPLATDEDVPITDAFSPDGLDDFFDDADGDPLTFTCAAIHLACDMWLDAGDRHEVNVTPERDWYGVDYLRIRATDPNGGFAEQTSRVTVRPVNDPPVLSWHDDVYVKYDVEYKLYLSGYVDDVDTPKSSLIMRTNRTDLSSVDMFTVTMDFHSSILGTISSVPLSISLYDGHARNYSNITVSVGNGDPPEPRTGTSLPDVTFVEDEVKTGVIDLDDYFMDLDGQPKPLSYTANATTVIAEVNAVGNYLNLSAPLNWFGQDTVRVRASDGLGFALAYMQVRVLPKDDAPVLTAIPLQDLGTGGMVVIDLRKYVTDVDDNVTDLHYSTDSPRAEVEGYMLILNYTSGASSERVTWTAKGSVESASSSFDVRITPLPPDDNDDNNLLAQIILPLSLIALLFIAALGALAYNRRLDGRYTVEDVFMVAKEGRLIMHTTRRLRADRDQDILAAMLTAIMMFIKDSFKEEGEDLRTFEFGDKKVLVERGSSFYLAAIYAGESPETADTSLADFTLDVQAHFGDRLVGWSGDVEDLKGLKIFMDSFVEHRRYRRGDWQHFARKKGELT